MEGLFQHALQFIPEQSDPVDFFEMYFDETQIKKANGESYSGAKSNGGQTQYSQGESNDQQMSQYTQGQNSGKQRGMAQSQSSVGIGANEQNPQFQGGATSKLGNKYELNGPQQNQNGQVKKITIKKLVGSTSQQSIISNQGDKDSKIGFKTKLLPIQQPKLQAIKLSKNNDPFNQHKDAFFHPPGTAQSSLSGAFPRGNTSINPSQNNTHYTNMHTVPANKNLRSNSNSHFHESLISTGLGPGNTYYKNPNQIGINAYNLDNSNSQQNQITESQGHNQSQYSVYDPNFRFNPNPYAADWANAILKEHYKVALKRIDEKNGRKRWIIRKIKMQNQGADQQNSGSTHHGDNMKGGRISTIVSGINQQHGLMKPENKLKKQSKKYQNIEGVNDVFTNAFIQKQKDLLSASQPELLELSELIEILSMDREYIAYNILNQPVCEKLKNINEDEFEENLQPYHEYVTQNINIFPYYHINFKKNLERTIFLNKLLIGNL